MKAVKEERLSNAEIAAVSHPVLLRCGKRTLNVLDQDFRVSVRGMTFKTDSFFEPFTNLQVRLRIPPTMASPRGHTIECEGAVVECKGDHKRRLYCVTVTFLNLTAVDQKHLQLSHLPQQAPQLAFMRGTA